MKKKLLFIFGTRPEAIKMVSIIQECKHSDNFDVEICTTGQHKEMLQQVMDFFSLKADYELNVMTYSQTLYHLTSSILTELQNIIATAKPDIVLVQGDTTTAFAGSLAAYYAQIPVAHIEAGLRSFDNYSPFPEEVNRKLIGDIATFHFCPTEKAKQNLINEGKKENLFVTGNTVIDALLQGVNMVRHDNTIKEYFDNIIIPDRKIILVTGHRRENFGKPFEEICNALLEIAETYNDVQIIYPVHLNPHVQKVVHKKLGSQKNITLINPLDYAKLIYLLDKSYLVLTDSGGIQEEAPSLGKPVVVLRNVTEREEGIEAGTAILAGTSKEKIIQHSFNILNNEEVYNKMAQAVNPYGIGNSGKQIVNILEKSL
ncbi:MAG: UDP-N-acetylglucosamine 2-epimerase (non-hydrolyzing) [Chitinophagaceae bacterium]|nr:UDP-N-acetylglucosamine 2-epimerase (non-hydrolyzing) [Chitinophagaceae bacterium]MCW5905304.1 UDP-N-acetylglucosamine 2-epimerase (non-hydrolyzing) [Chitinophagaceae bacterium]